MNVDVVIIDSGCGYYQNNHVLGGVSLCCNKESDYYDGVGHGSAVINIILNQNPNSTFFIIKVTDSYESFSYQTLCRAFDYILQNGICPKIINVSLGTAVLDNYTELHERIVKLYENNVLIISAYSNEGLITYPAAFDEVIGVDMSPNCKSQTEYEYVEDSIINIRGSSSYYRALDHNQKKSLFRGASFSTSYITGLLLQNMQTIWNQDCNILFNNAHSFLKQNAKLVRPYREISHLSSHENILSGVKKAITYPFNKEIHSLVRFQAMIPFEITGFYDYRISMYKGKRVGDLVNVKNDAIVTSYTEIDWNGEFELLICGHCQESNALAGHDTLLELIRLCIKYDKKMYAFDSLWKYMNHIPEEKQHLFYFPYVNEKMVKQNRFGKLRSSSKPIIGIYGTSSSQGKYTLQMYLREKFIEDGYKLGQISTEPSGYLFGIDYVYPMGYNASVYINTYDAVALLNEVVWEIERKNVDIIITGSQSGTIPYNVNHMSNINFSVHDFLIGTAPDAVILCINIYDDIGYIQRTINYIESLVRAKVLGLVLFPMDYDKSLLSSRNRTIVATDREMNIKKTEISFAANLPVYTNNKESIQDIYDNIINYFS